MWLRLEANLRMSKYEHILKCQPWLHMPVKAGSWMASGPEGGPRGRRILQV